MDGPARNSDPRVLRNQAFTAESLNLVKAWVAPLNITGKQTPMFFVFPMSLDGACYVRLSEALGEDQPFYAFQIPSKERRPETVTSIPQLAGHLIAELEKIYRDGAFILGGWSAGAVIALEMAQQLTRKGRPPVLLVSIDHAPFNTRAGINPFYPALLNHLIRLHVLWKKSRDDRWRDFIPSPSVAIAKRIFARIALLSSHARRNLRSGKAPIGHHPLQKHLDAARSPEARELLKKLYRLLIEYKPWTYDGRVLLFMSTEYVDFEWDRKWSIFAPNTKVRHFLGTPEAPTTHESFVRGEYVSSFAWALKEQVDLLLQRPSEKQGVTAAPAISEDAFGGDRMVQPYF
jgi:thioesterase domain-containing protein